jgi:hypothetical protein
MDMTIIFTKLKQRNLRKTIRTIMRNASAVGSMSSSEACMMQVYRADTNTLIDERKIGQQFQETVVTAPGKHPYYLKISCGSPSSTYKSPTYEFGTAEQFQHPVDLGTISLNGGPH